jgi:hypothetical protein
VARRYGRSRRAQQGDRVRRIAVLMPYDENDPVQSGKTIVPTHGPNGGVADAFGEAKAAFRAA